MTATYDIFNLTERDHVRFLVRDTDTADPIFQDEEIDLVLGDETATGAGRKYYAAARLLEILVSGIVTSRGPNNVREKHIEHLKLVWGADRDILEQMGAHIASLRKRGGYLTAQSCKVFRAVRSGTRVVD